MNLMTNFSKQRGLSSYLVIIGITVLSLLVFLISIGNIASIIQPKAITQEYSKLVEPPNLFYRLVTATTEEERYPVLRLSYELGENCDLVSQLVLERKDTQDGLEVNVLGYHLVKNGQSPCTPGIITRTEGKINFDDFKDGEVKKVIIKLNGQSNEFIIQRDKNKISILSVKEINIHPQTDGYSDPKTEALYPQGMMQLFVLGEVDWEKDYREELRSFSRTRNLVPADEIYPDIKQDNPTRLYVKAPYYIGLNEDGTSTELGPLPNNKGVDVFISKMVDLGNAD